MRRERRNKNRRDVFMEEGIVAAHVARGAETVD